MVGNPSRRSACPGSPRTRRAGSARSASAADSDPCPLPRHDRAVRAALNLSRPSRPKPSPGPPDASPGLPRSPPRRRRHAAPATPYAGRRRPRAADRRRACRDPRLYGPVRVGATQPQIERPGERRLDRTRVRTRMPRRITPPDPPRLTQAARTRSPVSTAHTRAGSQVDQVVEPRRRPAEVPVPRRTCSRPSRPACSPPDTPSSPGTPSNPPHSSGATRRVRGVLRDRLDSRTGQLIRLDRSVASRLHRWLEPLTCRLRSFASSNARHHLGLTLQAPPTEHGPRRGRRQQRSARPADRCVSRSATTPAAVLPTRPAALAYAVPAARESAYSAGLQPPGGLAEAGDRVEAARIAEPAVGGEAEEETERSGHPAKSARPGKFKGGRSVEG